MSATTLDAVLSDAEILKIANKFTSRFILRGQAHRELDALGFARELQKRIEEINKKGIEDGRQ